MPPSESQPHRLLLIGCGILQKEIRHLVAKNGWPVDTFFLPSSLHTDFGKLASVLDRSFATTEGRRRAVFYGACHPLMDRMIGGARTIRTPGQNCVDIYLGNEAFSRELAEGAFFLFEDWALHWDTVVTGKQGLAENVMREIFASSHTHLLGIRTPCSGDFTTEAEEISRRTSLPLRWADVGLEHLEKTLGATVMKALEEPL